MTTEDGEMPGALMEHPSGTTMLAGKEIPYPDFPGRALSYDVHGQDFLVYTLGRTETLHRTVHVPLSRERLIRLMEGKLSADSAVGNSDFVIVRETTADGCPVRASISTVEELRRTDMIPVRFPGGEDTVPVRFPGGENGNRALPPEFIQAWEKETAAAQARW